MRENYCAEEIVQNLKDAGCGDTLIADFINKVKKGELESGLNLLQRHRDCLLDNLHKDKKQIDCLDYLLYRIEKHA